VNRLIVSPILWLVLLFSAAAPLPAQIPGMGTGGSAAPVQTLPALPDPLTPEAVQALVARMSDDDVRAMLLERLDAVAQEQIETAAPRGTLDTIVMLWDGFRFSVLDAVMKVPTLIAREGEAIRSFVNGFEGSQLLTLFLYTAIALAAGYAAERGFGYFTQRWVTAPPEHDNSSLQGALRYLFRRFLREIVGLVVFYIVLRNVGLALLSPQQLAFAAPFVTFLIWMPRVAAAVGRFLLAPERPALRLINVDDHWAKYLFRNQIGLVFLAGLTMFVVDFNMKNGIMGLETRIGFWFDTAVYVYIIIIAIQARDGLISMMRGWDPEPNAFDEAIARGYPYFAIAVAAVMWVFVNTLVGLNQVTALLGGAHYVTMFWLLMAPALDTLIRALTRHLLPPMIGDGPIAEEAYHSTKRGYIKIGRVVAIIFVVLMIARAWDINLMNMAAAGVGAQFADNLIGFILTVAIGYIVYEGVSLWINRRLAREQTQLAGAPSEDDVGGDGGGAGKSRLSTVLPLARITAQTAIVVIFGLLAIGSLGIDITPLLAGAGILGLAIGFGAQKLVSDVVSGVFFLIDDAFRKGEYVDTGDVAGTVEKISIRSMQLRHHRGAVHTIPYGEIHKLTNFSRDWVIMKLKFTVPFETDANKVKKIFKEIGREMSEDPLYKDDFLQPFKSQGVLDFDDVGMVVRGKFMAKPGTQFTLRKEIFNKVKAKFAENGIDFARREVRVAMPDMDDHEDLNDAQKTAATAAAAEAVNQQMRADQP
jgi:small-conductance mechanosensitive channel